MKNSLQKIQLVLLIAALQFAFFTTGQTSYEKKLTESIRLEKNAKKKYLRFLSLGEYYKSINIHKADSMRHVLLAMSRQFEDSIRLSALMFSAEVNQLYENEEEYFKDVLAFRPFLSKLKSDEVVYSVYHHLGNYHSLSHEFRLAEFYLRSSLGLAIKSRVNARIAETYNVIARYHMLQNNKDSALFYSDMGLKYGRRSSGKNLLDECLNTQALIYDHFGQVELSVAKNILAAEWAEKTGDIYHLSQYYREIGTSQRQIKNLDDASYYLHNAHNYSKHISDYRQMGLSQIGIAYIDYERKKYRQAIARVEKALPLLNSVNDRNGLGEAYTLLGMIHREEKNYSMASTTLNQALVLYESVGNLERIAEVYYNVGTVFMRQKKLRNALNYIEKSNKLRRRSGNQNKIFESYRAIAELYHQMGSPEKALRFMQDYVNYTDSNSLVMSTQKIADLSENYRSEQRYRIIQSQADSIEQQRKEKILTATKLENSNLRNSFQLYVIIALLLFAGFAGLIIFYRSNQIKIKQQQREAEMSQTLLRAQMNPHFVFNAMSVIQSYIYDNDTVNSSKFLVNFSRLMRLILENSPKEFIPLDTEIEILNKYLETQKLRFGQRFVYHISVDENLLTEHTAIPPMITQPFVENAIEHGQLHTIEQGYISLLFERRGKLLEIKIEDNGIGRSEAGQNSKSKGHKSMAMDITKQRIDNLNHKYKTEGSLHVCDLNPLNKTGTKVLISLPYRELNTSAILP